MAGKPTTGLDGSCTGTVGPKHPDPSLPDSNVPGCDDTLAEIGPACPNNPPSDPSCRAWEFTDTPDSCFIEGIIDEVLGIAGANLNVFKLLGVHEQGLLIDVTGRGDPISNGNAPGFPSSNAFDTFITEWRSIQLGDGVKASAFIGYDFGIVKSALEPDRRIYGIEANVRKMITAINIKQSDNPENRVTRARLERSDDGVKWYGVQTLNLPDDNCLNLILSRDSVPMRFWRLRPVDFNGGVDDYWGVQALQMIHNYVATNIDTIQDKIFMENRDRDYADDSILIKGSYDLLDVQTELSRFGIELPSQTIFATVSFRGTVALLGRPIIIGDIVQIPSETQFSPDLRPILKWMEVTDVGWATEGYTPGWKPTLQRITMQPAFASQETQDIFGDLAENDVLNELGLQDKGTGQDPNWQDFSDIAQTIEAEAKTDVPEKGREFSSVVRQFEPEELEQAALEGQANLSSIGQNPLAVYAEDAMPPNDAPFTEGDEFPGTPAHGNYHRLTYTQVSFPVPARLYRYSMDKSRWLFLEKDRRAEFDPDKPKLQEFLTSSGARPHTNIIREDDC